MRTLALSLLALLAMTFALLSGGGPVAAEPTDKEKSEMAAKVYTLLKDKCYGCHGEAGKKVMGKKGTLNYILDHDKLISEKLIDTASPEKSELYEEINEGNMPRELDKDGKPKTKKKLAQADIDLVLNWIKAGAPKWAPVGGKPFIGDLRGHTQWVQSVRFSPDGKFVITGSWDDTAILWDALTGKEIRKFEGYKGSVQIGGFSPDSNYVVTSSGTGARIWEVATGKEAIGIEGGKNCSTFTPDGKHILTGSGDPTEEVDSNVAQLWDAATGEEIRKFVGHKLVVTAVASSPDGKYVLTGSWDKTARLWETASGKEIRQFGSKTGLVCGVAFSPDGKSVLIASAYIAYMFDTESGKQIQTFEGHEADVHSVAFSPDGKRVLTTGEYSARLWDASTAKEIRKFTDGESQVWCAAFSPDGKVVATAHDDKTARTWKTDPAGG